MGLRDDLERMRAEAQAEESRLTVQVRVGSWIRLLLFFAFVGCWAAAWYLEQWGPARLSVIPAVIFPFVVVAHERRRSRLLVRRTQIELLDEKLARLASVRYKPVHEHQPIDIPHEPLDSGRRAADSDDDSYELGHFVLKDLDVVSGVANLLDAVDMTQTPFGYRRLRYRLANPLLNAGVIRRRQEAVRELAADRELRWKASQWFHPLRRLSLDHLTSFVREPVTVAKSRTTERVFLMLGCLPPLAVVAFVAGVMPAPLLLPVIIASGAVAVLNLKHVLAMRPRVYEIEVWCKAMESFTAEQARRQPQCELLRELGETFALGTSGPLDRRWSTLRRRIGLLHWGDYGLLSLIWVCFTLWDLHFAARVERSLKGFADAILDQASALGEWESLASLAEYHEERSDSVFPEIVDGEASLLEIRGGRHPYLEIDTVVANDVELGQGRNLLIITGSNMAGKSTFLKMISLHIILAQLGAPVRADSMRLRPVRLFTVIDVEDDLVHGFSYFRVEVDRVMEVIRAALAENDVLAIFDELFRGTNSIERVLAGREILRSLAATSGSFLMATHDMEYASLPDELDGAHNIHFTEEVDEKGVHFTYEAKPGPATVRNALRVLEFCGIPSDIIERARRGLDDGATA